MSLQGYRRYGAFVESRLQTDRRPTKLRTILADGYWKKQYRIADEIGISRTTFNRYVNGGTPIAPHHLVELCKFFSLPPSEIMGLVEDIDYLDPFELD